MKLKKAMIDEDNGRTLAEIDPELASVLIEIKEAVKGVIGDDFRLFLFGSRARGDHEADSDVDLMVTIPDELYTAEMRHDIRYAVYDFDLRADHVFSVIVLSESLFREQSGFKAVGAAEREGIAV